MRVKNGSRGTGGAISRVDHDGTQGILAQPGAPSPLVDRPVC